MRESEYATIDRYTAMRHRLLAAVRAIQLATIAELRSMLARVDRDDEVRAIIETEIRRKEERP